MAITVAQKPLADGNAGNGEQGRSAPPDAIPGAHLPLESPAVSGFRPQLSYHRPYRTGLLEPKFRTQPQRCRRRPQPSGPGQRYESRTECDAERVGYGAQSDSDDT